MLQKFLAMATIVVALASCASKGGCGACVKSEKAGCMCKNCECKNCGDTCKECANK
jgi:hypothetical protein